MIFSGIKQSTKPSSKLQEKLDVDLKRQQETSCKTSGADACKCDATSEKLAWVTKQSSYGKVGILSGLDEKKK